MSAAVTSSGLVHCSVCDPAGVAVELVDITSGGDAGGKRRETAAALDAAANPAECPFDLPSGTIEVALLIRAASP